MNRRPGRAGDARVSRGFTLVELMISMLLGLIVVAGVISVLVANKRTYRSTEGLSQVQESARTAFELLARDVRQAGNNGCGNTNRIANVLKNSADWWTKWFGTRGYESSQVDPAAAVGSNIGERVAGTDSFQLQGIEGTGLSVVTHNPTSAEFKINSVTTSFVADDILMVCDFDHATIFQVSNYNSANVTVVHNTGNPAHGPGNCSKGLGYPTDCSSTNGNAYTYGPNSQLARFTAVDWYIGNNGRAAEGGRSLYRVRLDSGAVPATEEVVAGVRDMQVLYRVNTSNSFVEATSVAAADWVNVNAMQVILTVDSADQRISTDLATNSGRLQRTFTALFTLRNRVP